MTPHPFARPLALALALLLGGHPAMGQATGTGAAAAPAKVVAKDSAPAPSPAPVTPVASISAPPLVPYGAPLVAYADQSVSTAPLMWDLIEPAGAYEVWDAPATATTPGVPGGLFLIRHPAPGVTYKLAVIATGTARPFAFKFAEITTAPGPGPVPIPTPPIPPAPPGPTPAPDPIPPVPIPPAPPVPVASIAPPFAVTLVIDDATITPAQAAAFDSPTIGPAIRALGGHFYGVKVGSAEYARRKLAAYAPAGATPALIVQPVADHMGTPSRPIPPVKFSGGEAEILARVKSLLGAAQ